MGLIAIKYELKYNPKSKKKSDNNVENFYSHYRMKIYDEKAVKSLSEEKWAENEDKKTYKFDVDENLLKKYENQPEIYRYLKKMSDNKSIYSVVIQPNRSFRFRNDAAGRLYKTKLEEYKKTCDNQLSALLANDDAKKYAQENDIVPSYTYYITIFSKGLSGLLQQLFISTLAYEECGMDWPDGQEKEHFVIEFDTQNKTAKLVSICIYNPDDPYNKYIRKSLRIVRKFNETKASKDDLINYYIDDKITAWCRFDEEEFESYLKSDDNRAGIYMLYDSQNGYFYVGKAEYVFKRMKEHKKSEELIKDFDYYRYSLIDPYYYDDIFFIENAAIHDCAMILNMIANKDYEDKSLSVSLPDGKDIKEIHMVNSVKKQTKRPKKIKQL